MNMHVGAASAQKEGFKVGDRVRGTGFSVGYDGKTVEGTISQTDKYDSRLPYFIEFEDGSGTWLKADTVELIPTEQPLTIQAGKFYRTRDGRKVGPMKPWDPESDWDFESRGYLWKRDGTNYDGPGCDHDLIAEWTDPPRYTSCAAAEVDNQREEYGVARKFPVGSRVVRTNGIAPNTYGTVTGHAAARLNTVEWDDGRGNSNTWQDRELRLVAGATSGKGKPKFKVGDRVNWIDQPDWQGITITEADGVVFEWRVEREDGEYAFANSRDLELASPTPTPAIVCRIDNGAPRPNPRPHVHDSEESATAEAERLAAKNPGQEFAVYVQTARRIGDVTVRSL